MNVRDYRFLLAERATLRGLIDEAGADQVIVRASFEHRLRDVEAELAVYGELTSRQVDACLTFSGAPIVGNRGMSADFFSDGVAEFAKSVHYIGAGQRQTPLPSSGTVPFLADYRLLVTGIARGSFGVRVEEASNQFPLPGQSSYVEMAIHEFKSILEASVGDDEQLANAVGEIDLRSLGQVRNFLTIVADNDAVCALEFRGHEFGFRDTAQLLRSVNRLSNDNIQEADAIIAGEFLGFFPHRPRAQFRIGGVDVDFLNSEIGRTITARVALAGVDDLDINSILNQPVQVHVSVRRVGAGRPRYVITGVLPRSE